MSVNHKRPIQAIPILRSGNLKGHSLTSQTWTKQQSPSRQKQLGSIRSMKRLANGNSGLGMGGIVGNVGTWFNSYLVGFNDLFRLTNLRCNLLIKFEWYKSQKHTLQKSHKPCVFFFSTFSAFFRLNFRKDVPPYMIDRITMPSWQTWSKVGVMDGRW